MNRSLKDIIRYQAIPRANKAIVNCISVSVDNLCYSEVGIARMISPNYNIGQVRTEIEVQLLKGTLV